MTTYNPIAARDIRVQDTSGREAWAAIARTVLPSTLAASDIVDKSGPMGSDSTFKSRYARTESGGGSQPRGESLDDGPLYWPSCGHFSETYAHGPQCPANRAYAGGGE